LSQEDFGKTYFERGPMPGGVLTLPPGVKKEDKDQLREDFQRVYGGSKNAGRVVVLTGQQSFTKLDLNNTDSQFLESRRFSIEDVSRWFGVPPHKLADLTRATFSNIEHQAIEFVVDCLMPWARRFESEVDLKLFGRVNRGKFWTKHNFAAFLRGDSITQTQSLAAQVNGGMRTPNEAREQLDLNPIKGGDTPLIQGAMIPLERALEEPEPPQSPFAPGSPTLPPDESEGEDDSEGSEDTPPKNLLAPLHRMFASTCERLIRVEADKARRAQNRGKLEEWRKEFYGNADSAAEQYLPDVVATMESFGCDIVKSKQIAAGIASVHNRYGATANDLVASLADPHRPANFAKDCVGIVWRNRQ
jgi:hypothetical protein